MSHSDRSARNIQDGGKDFEAGELIKTKLERVIRYIAAVSEFVKSFARLSPEEQKAVRILRSRQRAIDREWLAKYGNGRAMRDARIELSLQSKDDGTLIKFGEKMHSQGRLDCKACATSVDDTTFIPVPVARLCSHCKSGVEHVFDVLEVQPVEPENHREGLIPAGGPLPGLPRGQETTEKGDRKVVYIRCFYCEWCKHTEEVTL